MNTSYSDGRAAYYYFNEERINLSPMSFAKLHLKHNLERNLVGMLKIVSDDSLREKGVYVLDSILPYDGENFITVYVYNFGKKPYIIEEDELVCSFILNAFEEEK